MHKNDDNSNNTRFNIGNSKSDTAENNNKLQPQPQQLHGHNNKPGRPAGRAIKEKRTFLKLWKKSSDGL